MITTKQNSLDDYEVLINQKTHPKTTEDFDSFLEGHHTDNFTHAQVEEFEEKHHLKLGVHEIKHNAPDANLLETIGALLGQFTGSLTNKFTKYLGLHQDKEKLTNIEFERDQKEKIIIAKWETIQQMFPQLKNFQTQEEFHDWTSKISTWVSSLSPEQLKTLQGKNISLKDAWNYKQISNNHVSAEAPSLIFKLHTQFYSPKIITSAITRHGLTNQEYETNYRNQSAATQKSILRHDKKESIKTEKKESRKNITKKPTGFLKKFKKKYGFLDYLQLTPRKVVAEKIATQEEKISEKNGSYDPIWIAYIVEELSDPEPEPYDEPPPTHNEPPPSNSETNSDNTSHSNSNYQKPNFNKKPQQPIRPQNLASPASRNSRNNLARQALSRNTKKRAAVKTTTEALRVARIASLAPYLLGCSTIIILLAFLSFVIFIITMLMTSIGGNSGSNNDPVIIPPAYRQKNKLYLSETGPTKAKVGDILEYTITVAYQDTVQNIIITDQLPDGTEYLSSSPSASLNGNTLTWNMANIINPTSGSLQNVNETLYLKLKATKDNDNIVNIATGSAK